jgi:iron complex transport system ATP-binding protein
MKEKESSVKVTGMEIGYISGRKKRIVKSNIKMELHPGEISCLLGLNGSGKSTLLRTLCGFQPALNGEILFYGKSIKKYSQSNLSRIVGVVLTEKTNAGGITAYELVGLGRYPHTGFLGNLKENDHRIISSALEATGMAHKAKFYVSELSDGERQKIMIAKALAQECPIIILDEPTAFLDVTSRIETIALLRKMAHEKNKTVFLSTHDIDSAIQMSDRIWLIDKEKPIVSGAPEDLIMKGEIGKYFNKENIFFDINTGKLNTIITATKPIGIEGDFTTSFWIGNALVRNGFTPSPISSAYPNIYCHGPQKIEIRYPDGKISIFPCVADLCDSLSD